MDRSTLVPTNRDTDDAPRDERDHKEEEDSTNYETDKEDITTNTEMASPPRIILEEGNSRTPD